MNRDLSRRALLAAGAALATLPTSALAAPTKAALAPVDQALVDQAVAYLQGLSAAQGRFRQTDSRGTQTTGRLWLQRPGRARFAYDPPSGLVLVSDGRVVAQTNTRLKTTSRVPLAATPLALFLAKDIRLDRGVVITEVRRFGDGFSIVARDGRKQTPGQIELRFSDSPLALTGWTIIDNQSRATRVELIDLQRVGSLDGKLFVVPPPPKAATARP
ncbi:outer membrane lipoprotein-sorting protein [Caulobacter ginsengisoli]|uniref:Outer membrane lipoprotein-sorting protein n=1 Tax=Caulobacter ginsengisoli TaxID=400775 RepID=A0ABU0IWD9_9CAUL|nr:outer-membrane lipoprotein carrier protein LolA [Caulobacter ginsengisoli]MDQ0465329.1 outer membrane lipoprotein-sorting protein [Caulobacter ginsengisoli]